MEELLITLAEEETLEQSKNEVRTIADAFAKSKAYYNALAANAVMDYLGKNCLLKSKPVNLHSSAKMLVDFEIADIQLPNLHIDVRAVFDEDEIFIPKKHFTNKILPDIYLVMKLDEDLSSGTLLGYIKPDQINTKNQNDEYYFVNKSALTSASNLADLILSTPEKNQYMLSENAENTLEKLIMQYMDHDIDDVKLEKLIDYLKNSIIAREKLIEFENFERLSYMALKEFKDLDVENNDFSKYIRTLVTTDEFAQFDGDFVDSVQSESDVSAGLFIDETEENELTTQKETVEEQEEFDAAAFEEDSVGEELVETEQDLSADEQSVLGNSESLESVDSSTNVENVEDVEPIDEDTLKVLDEFDAFETVDEFDIPDEMFENASEEPVEALELHEDIETPNAEDVIPGVEDVTEETTEEVISPIGEDVTPLAEDDKQSLENAPAVEQEFVDNIVVLEGSVTEELDLNETPVLEDPLIDIEENVESTLIEEPATDVESTESESVELPELNEEPLALETELEKSVNEDIGNFTESLSGEDLELQLDGLESIGDDLNLELHEENVEPVDFDSPVDAVVAEEPEHHEEPAELDVSEALQLDEVELAGETVVGLSEGVMLDAEIAEKELDLVASEDEIKPADLIESITDEDVDNAIASSAELEKDTAPVTVDDILTTDDSDNLSLEDLLSMENDLSASEEEPNHIKFIDDDEEDDEIKSAEENTQVVDESDLDFLNGNAEEQSSEVPEAVDEIYGDESGSDNETDFAFAIDQRPPTSKNNILLPVAAFVAILGLAGAGAWYFLFNGKSSSNDIGVVDNSPVTPVQDVASDVKDVVPSSVDESLTTDIQIPEDASNTPVQKKAPQQQAELPDVKPPVAKDVKPVPEPLTIQKIKKDFSQPNTYLSVSKIVWDVPEYLTYNDDFSGYLQTLGSTLKLNLSSDLLLINENTILDRVKVKIQLKDSGKKYSAELVDGCGTKSVDDLVLQSVKNTLNLLKPPVNSLDTADEDLYITIYL